MGWGIVGDFANAVGDFANGVGNLASGNQGVGQVRAAGAAGAQAQDPGVWNNPGSWDNTQDAAVGGLDKQIADMQKYIDAGSTLYKPEQLKDLQAQRAYANQGRWQSANLTGSPGRDQLKQALDSGQLTYADLGGLDISVLQGDDAQLSAQVGALLQAKAAPPPAAPPPPAAAPAVDPTQAAANQATSSILPETEKLLGQQNAGLKAYDQGAQAAQSQIGSTASMLGNKLGVAGGSALANEASTANQANEAAGRSNLQKDNYNALNQFINQAVTSTIGGQIDMTQMNSAKGLQVQGQAMDSLLAEIQKSTNMSDESAKNQMAQLTNAIQAFKTAQAGSMEQNNERNQIIALSVGLLGAGLGAAAGSAGGPLGAVAGASAGGAAGNALGGVAASAL